MKKVLFLVVSLLCVGVVVPNTIAQKTEEQSGRRKQKRRSLAEYFGLGMRVDVVESEVVEVSNGDKDESIASTQAPQDEALFSAIPEDQEELVSESEEVMPAEEDQERDVEPEELPSVSEEGSGASSEDDDWPEQSEDEVASQERIEREPADLEGEELEDKDFMPAQEPQVYRQSQALVDTQADEYLEDVSIDVEEKKDAAIKLVSEAVEFFNEHSLDESLNRFSHTKDFVRAELYIFVYDSSGVCVAHPHSPNLLWKRLYDMQDTFGRYPVRGMIDRARHGGGWVTYEWEDATKMSYVRRAQKDGREYILGAGFYSHSKRDAVINLVKSAVSFFDHIIQQDFSPMIAFSAFTYPVGEFIYGDLYTYCVRFDGVTVAHGDNPGLIGTTSFEETEQEGQHVNQEIIDKLQKGPEGVWVEYISKGTIKKVYAEKVMDKEGTQYFIACGYYPDAGRKEAVDLVRKAYNYMKANGKSAAARQFDDPKNNDFRFGDLYIFVYNTKGLCVAHGNNPTLVGKNRIDVQDTAGHYYVRECIKKAQEGGGWVNYKINKLFRSVYVELIDLGVEQYVIGSGLYPISKRETMILMVKGAASYLELAETTDALREFVRQDSKYTRGDLRIFVLEDNGICLAYGDEYDLIWRNLMHAKDDNQDPFIRRIIESAQHGPGMVKYKLNSSPKISYVEPVVKNGRRFIVGSGYYL